MAYYGSIAGADAYHDARGNTSWTSLASSAKEAALTRGSDYVDQRYRKKLASGRWLSLFSGSKAQGRSQEREWPRVNASDYEGVEIADNVTPIEVEHATYEAALREAATPGSLSPDFVPSEQVLRVTVGPITEQYASAKDLDDSLPNRPVIPVIDEIIAPVLTPRYLFPGVRTV